MRVPARKSLGQHFLRHPELLAKIAAATGAGDTDVVLEIGPGEGSLTAALLDRGATVVAIERDQRMSSMLIERFRGAPFALIEGDALTLDWAGLVTPWTSMGKTWRVAGNIPYYITSPLLDKALTPPLPASVTYLVQKEVAERVVANAGDDAYGGLSIGIQVAAHPEKMFNVSRGAFVPPPKVDSAVLHLVPHSVPLVEPARLGEFRHLVTSMFSYRRKKMSRGMREAFGISAEEALIALERAGISPDVRPEVVSVEQWIRLAGAMAKPSTG